MSCAFQQDVIQNIINFHGHNCPGLAIGIRTAELALEKLDPNHTEDWVCVTETDMCGVDAIQYMTGCTFGKGNMIHKDYGKSVFTFFDRKTQKGFRALFNDSFKPTHKEMSKAQRIQTILDADLSDLFQIKEVGAPPVRPARILKSIPCDHCHEPTMESRVRLFGGEHLCIPCFEKVEQKI